MHHQYHLNVPKYVPQRIIGHLLHLDVKDSSSKNVIRIIFFVIFRFKNKNNELEQNIKNFSCKISDWVWVCVCDICTQSNMMSSQIFILHSSFSILIFFVLCLSYFGLFFLSSDSRIFVHYFNFLLFSSLLFPLLPAFHTSSLHSYCFYSDFDPRRFSTFRCYLISTKSRFASSIQPSHSSARPPVSPPVRMDS
jgi:hypothetical protein